MAGTAYRAAFPTVSATTNTLLWTTAAQGSILSSISICNTNATAITYRIFVGTDATPAIGEYIFYDVVLGGNATDVHNLGIGLQSGTNLYGYASAANVAFVISGADFT